MSERIQPKVEALHRRVIRIDRVRSLARLFAVSLAVAGVAVAVDAAVRWPMAVRFVVLLAGLATVVRAMHGALQRAWFHAPGASSVALRLEHVEPGLRGVLASGYELERSGESDRSELAGEVVDQASIAWAAAAPERRVRSAPAMHWLSASVAASVAWCGFAFLWPTEATVGLRRTFTPWVADQWPARVVLQADMPLGAVARGSSVPLRVRVTRGDDARLQVRARCESFTAAGKSSDREFELARQADGSHERPVVAEGDRMRVRFAAGDGETEVVELAVVTPPSIERGSIEVRPPAYAAAEHPALRSSWQGVTTPDIGAALAGSEVVVRVELAAAAAPSAAAVQAFDDHGQPRQAPVVVAESETSWRVMWVAEQASDLVVRPVDARGVQAPEALRIGLRVTPDDEPTVSVTEPDADETVTPEATVPFRVDARDDHGLASIGWRLDRQQRSGEPSPVKLREEARTSTVREDSSAGQLSIASVQARAGDTLLLRGFARDRLERPGVVRATVSSDARKLRVVERDTFERQVRQQVAALRQAAARLETSQQEIARENDPAAAARSEAGLGERVHQGNEAARRLVQRLKRNGLQQLPLTETLQEAARLGEQAEREAARAQDALRRAATGEPNAMPQARDAQKAAESALRDMIDLLDRDDDAAAAQRRADRLAESIARLREELRKASRASAGKSPEELDPQERQSMQEQSAKQRAAAAEAAAMIDDMRARADRAQSKDQAQAKSLRQAADEGERGQASRRMDEAADRTDRNQATAADEAMQAAAETVDRMRDALRDDRRARTEDLKRRLASLVEALQAMIAEGEAVLGAIDATPEAAATRLLQLSRNARAASEEARGGDRSLLKVVGVIERAVERFEAGVTPLRAQPTDAASARGAVSRGIDLLREALKAVREAQQSEQQKASERDRAQLERQYRELAAQVRSVREATAGTLPPAGGRLDRRGASVQREQAQRLQGVQRSFDAGPKASDMVKQATTFTAVHNRIDRDLAASQTALDGVTADAGTVQRLDMAAESLEALAFALATPDEPDDPFADAAKEEGEQAPGGGGAADEPRKLPPIAELKLVRQLQQQVMQRTRVLDEARSAGAQVDAELRELSALQDEVRRLGEDWIHRMEERGASHNGSKPGAKPKPADRPRNAFSHIFGMQGESRPAPTDASPAQPAPTPPGGSSTTAAPPADAPKTLDELLGITAPGGADEAARLQRERQLKRSLNEEDLDDLAKAALESMSLATDLVRDKRETGLGTQRVQRKAVDDLDALIDAATRFSKQQQQQKKGSGGSSQAQRQKSNQQGEPEGGKPGEPKPGEAGERTSNDGARRNPQGTTGDQVDPPPPEEAAMAANGTIVEGRSEWGRLPQRIREIMSQARRDRISAIYQQATEAYYRRLAEERGP